MITTGAVVADSSDAADSSFEITYTLKDVSHTVKFDGPVDKVVVFGYAACLTILDTGLSDKIYACDKYGDNAYTDKGIEKKAKSIANLSASNVDSIYSQIIQAVENKELSKNDAIIFTTMTTPSETLRGKLEAEGFTHVVFYGTMIDYEELTKCIFEIEEIVGSTKNLHKTMEVVKNTVADKLSGVEKKDALFVWYSASDGWGYGNTGSLSVALMNAANANNLGYNPGSTKSIIYDKSAVIQKLSDSPTATIFLDSGYIRTNGGTVQGFVDDVLGGQQGQHQICVVLQQWNNYDPESAEGLWEMAGVLYPDIISGNAPVYTTESSNDNLLLYGGIGVVIVVIIGAVAMMVIRRKG